MGQCGVELDSTGECWAVLGSARHYKRKSSAAHVTEVLQHFSLVIGSFKYFLSLTMMDNI